MRSLPVLPIATKIPFLQENPGQVHILCIECWEKLGSPDFKDSAIITKKKMGCCTCKSEIKKGILIKLPINHYCDCPHWRNGVQY